MDNDLGQRIRTQRLRAGMSQTALAERSGIPKPRLSRYENGHIVPSIGSLQRLAHALEISPGELLGADDPHLETFLDDIRRSGIHLDSTEEAHALAAEVIDLVRQRIERQA